MFGIPLGCLYIYIDVPTIPEWSWVVWVFLLLFFGGGGGSANFGILLC